MDEPPTDDPGEVSGQWRAFSDGTSRGTKVFAPNGHDVTEQLKSLSFYIDANTMAADMTLEVSLPGVAFLAGSVKVEHTCVGCGELIEHECKPT